MAGCRSGCRGHDRPRPTDDAGAARDAASGDAASTPADAATAPPDGGTRPARAAGSLDLIDQADAKGELDAETALTFRVFATFGDARLPARFHGDDTGRFGIGILGTVSERFDSLSAEAQRTLGPFLVPPPYRAGLATARASERKSLRPQCNSLDGRWTFAVGSQTPHVQVWYQPSSDKAGAEALAREIETRIWPKLIALPPLGEGLLPPERDSTVECNGGTDLLDLYLIDMPVESDHEPLGAEEASGCKQTPVVLFVKRDAEDLAVIAAHEIMHAIQYAYKSSQCVSSYGWLLDATAVWASDYVYNKGDNSLDHPWAHQVLITPDRSIEDQMFDSDKGPHVGRDYGAYLFFQFLTRTQGVGSVRRVWEATTSHNTAAMAVDGTMPGGWREQWPAFARKLLNREPVNADGGSFKEWDELTEKPVMAADVHGDLKGKTEDKTELRAEIENLSTQYYRFDFSDPNTRSLLFYNGYFEQEPDKRRVKVRAMWIDASEAWHEEDWTPYEYAGLCRDLRVQRASELILVVSNSEFTPKAGKLVAGKAPYLKRSNLGCWKYEGKVTAASPIGRSLGIQIESEHVSFEIEPGETGLAVTHPEYPNVLRAFLPLRLAHVGRDYSVRVDFVSGSCHLTAGPVSFAIGGASSMASGYLMTNPFPELHSEVPFLQRWLHQPVRSYSAVLTDPQQVPTTVRCPDRTETTVTPVSEILLTDKYLVTSAVPPVAAPSGDLDSHFEVGPTTWTWTLRPQRQ